MIVRLSRIVAGSRIGLVAALACLVGCVGRREPSHPLDLTASFETAARQPAGGPFEIGGANIDGQSRPTIAVPVASRITWKLQLPDSARLHTWLAVESTCAPSAVAGVEYRVGISDERSYDELAVRKVSASQSVRWELATVDLSDYSGFQWSLFYRPREIAWRLIFNTRSFGPVSAGCALRPRWGAPVIESVR